MNLFLHMGIWKTGTSSIQHYLNQNYSALLKQGYCYPATGRKSQPGHHIFAWALHGRSHSKGYERFGKPTPEKMKYMLLQELEKNECNNVILSSEVFYNNNYEDLRSLFSEFNIKIIIYLRAQDKHIESGYRQIVKGHMKYDMTFKKYFNSLKENDYKIYRHYDRLEKLSETFGQNNLIVRVYEKSQLVNGDAVDDFVSILEGMDNSFFERKFTKVGTTPSSATIELLRLFNQERVEISELDRFSSVCDSYFKSCKENSYLSHEQRVDLMGIFEEDNEKIAKKYLKRKDGILFKDPLTQSVGSFSNKVISREGLIKLIAHIWNPQ